MNCKFCGRLIRGAYVSASSGVYCLGHEPSARPDEKDLRIAELEAALKPLAAAHSNVSDDELRQVIGGTVFFSEIDSWQASAILVARAALPNWADK